MAAMCTATAIEVDLDTPCKLTWARPPKEEVEELRDVYYVVRTPSSAGERTLSSMSLVREIDIYGLKKDATETMTRVGSTSDLVKLGVPRLLDNNAIQIRVTEHDYRRYQDSVYDLARCDMEDGQAKVRLVKFNSALRKLHRTTSVPCLLEASSPLICGRRATVMAIDSTQAAALRGGFAVQRGTCQRPSAGIAPVGCSSLPRQGSSASVGLQETCELPCALPRTPDALPVTPEFRPKGSIARALAGFEGVAGAAQHRRRSAWLHAF